MLEDDVELLAPGVEVGVLAVLEVDESVRGRSRVSDAVLDVLVLRVVLEPDAVEELDDVEGAVAAVSLVSRPLSRESVVAAAPVDGAGCVRGSDDVALLLLDEVGDEGLAVEADDVGAAGSDGVCFVVWAWSAAVAARSAVEP